MKTKLDARTCFKLDGTGPITQINGQPCFNEDTAKPSDIPEVCPFNLIDGTYGWVNESLQQQTPLFTAGFGDDSQIKYKKTSEYCVSVSAYSSMLNPGRDCGDDYQCMS